MTCDEFTDIVSDYLEGNVPFGQRIGAWVHMLICKHCRRYYQQMREVVELSGELGDSEDLEPAGPDDEVKSDLVAQFRERNDTSAED